MKLIYLIPLLVCISCGVVSTPDDQMDSWGSYYERPTMAIGEETRVDMGKKDGTILTFPDITVVITDKGWGAFKTGPGWVTPLNEDQARRLLRKEL